MPVTVGTGPGEYPPTIQYLVNGEPADDITFNRPTTDLDDRTEALRLCIDSIEVADIGGLVAALSGAAPLHPNLIQFTTLNYASHIGELFTIDGLGNVNFVPNLVSGEVNTGNNLGAGVQVFESKVLETLQFRTLVAGTNINLNQTANEIEIVSAPGEIPRITKLVKNTTGVAIPAFRALAWLDDGSVGLADANISSLTDIAGISLAAIPDGQFGLAVKFGNIPGALTGLGRKPGERLYLSETPGLIATTSPPLSGPDDVSIILGHAEPPDGVATADANDLFMQLTILSEGGV